MTAFFSLFFDLSSRESVFKSPYHLLFGLSIGPAVSSLIRPILLESKNRKVGLEELESVRNALLSTPTPWVNWSDIQVKCPFWIHFGGDNRGGFESELLTHSPETLFTILLLIATIAEIDEKRHGIKDILSQIHDIDAPLLNIFRNTILTRYDEGNLDEVDNELSRCGFGDEQKNFIRRWIDKKVDFVGDESDAIQLNVIS